MTDDESKACRDVVNAVLAALDGVPKAADNFGDFVQGTAAAIDTTFRHETGVDVHVRLSVMPFKSVDVPHVDNMQASQDRPAFRLLENEWKLVDGVPTLVITDDMLGKPTPPLSYQWSRNGVDIPGETSVSFIKGEDG